MHVAVLIPADPVVTWAEAQAHLRLDDDDEEREYVEGLVKAATAWIDGPSGWLGISIGRQTLEARLDRFEGLDLRLPYGPVISIVDMVYLDASSAEQPWPAQNYVLLQNGRLVRNPGGAGWPTTTMPEGIRILYEAGHDEAPEPIKQAILLLVGQWFRTRSSVVVGTIVAEVPFAVKALLAPFESWHA